MAVIGPLRLPETSVGMTEQSTTRRFPAFAMLDANDGALECRSLDEPEGGMHTGQPRTKLVLGQSIPELRVGEHIAGNVR